VKATCRTFVSNGSTGINTFKGLHLENKKLKLTFIFLLWKVFFTFVPSPPCSPCYWKFLFLKLACLPEFVGLPWGELWVFSGTAFEISMHVYILRGATGLPIF